MGGQRIRIDYPLMGTRPAGAVLIRTLAAVKRRFVRHTYGSFATLPAAGRLSWRPLSPQTDPLPLNRIVGPHVPTSAMPDSDQILQRSIMLLRAEPDMHRSILLCQGLCNLASAVDKKLRDRAKRAGFRDDDSVWQAGHRQFNGQCLDLQAPGRKSQCGSRENRDKAAGREQTRPRLGGFGDHRRAGTIESAGAKSFYHN